MKPLWKLAGARGLATAFAASLGLCACTLPMEQLSLPSPIGPPSGIETGATPGGAQGPSVPLGDPAAPPAERKRVYPGSGNFNATPRDGPGRAFGAVTGNGDVTLDLVDASIPEAARAVLGDVLGVTYVVSDKVKGSVTLRTASPVSKDTLVEIFESVLDAQGAALLVDGAVYKVVPRDEALAAGKTISSRLTPGPRKAGVASEIVPIKHVSATEIERVLKAVAPQGHVAHVDSDRNLVILSGTRTEIASMLDTIATFDVDWMRGMSFGIFPVETSDVEAIAQELDTIFANDRDSPTKGVVRFVPNARLKAILVITSRPQFLAKAETWIKRIDMAGQETERRAFVYQVQYRPVQELAQVLSRIYGGRGRGAGQAAEGAPTTTGALPDGTTFSEGTVPVPPTVGHRSTAALSQPPFSVPPGAFDPGRLAAAAATPAAPQPQEGELAADDAAAAGAEQATRSGMLARPELDDQQSGISIVADESNNALIITATPAELKRIRQVLAQMDTLPAQVLLEATIAEVTLNDDLRFGLRWFFEKGASTFTFTDSALGAVNSVFPGFSYLMAMPDARVVLNALADVTNVDVVSSPSLMVLNNKKAVLQIGDEVPVATQSAVSVLTPDAPIVNSIAFRNTGVILNIVPRVSEDGRVLLEIEQEVSDVRETTSSTIDSPTIQQRRVKTTVVVNNGGSVVLAGMMQDRASRIRQQIPLAGDIPLLGNLFKNKDDTISRTELLIAITPHVVTDGAQSSMIAAEFRDRLNFSTRPQRQTPPDRREQVDRIVR